MCFLLKLASCLGGRDYHHLNKKSVRMEPLEIELARPKDRLNIVYLIMLLHGIGALMPWNMFITAKDYFADYKLSKNYTGFDNEYATNFLSSIGFAAQIPNVMFSWLNIFLPLGGNLTVRIVYGIFVEAIIFIITVVLAIVDSSGWPGIFFWTTMTLVVILNIAVGIYQNSVFGMAAKLPGKYTGAVVLGSNISGVFTALVSLLSKIFSPGLKTAAIYYFITALFVLLACFDTYFALPHVRYYRYYTERQDEEISVKSDQESEGKISYWKAFKQCWVQSFNVWFTLFITLSVFPAIQADIKKSDENFIVPDKYYTDVMCYLVFNVTAMLGSWLGTKIHWPSKKYLIVPILLRVVYIPLFLYCNYRPNNIDRVLPVYIDNDWVFFGLGVTMGLTSGYFSTLAMQYGPMVVQKQYSTVAGMFGAAFLVTGVLSGVLFSFIMPTIVANFSHR